MTSFFRKRRRQDTPMRPAEEKYLRSRSFFEAGFTTYSFRISTTLMTT